MGKYLSKSGAYFFLSFVILLLTVCITFWIIWTRLQLTNCSGLIKNEVTGLGIERKTHPCLWRQRSSPVPSWGTVDLQESDGSVIRAFKNQMSKTNQCYTYTNEKLNQSKNRNKRKHQLGNYSTLRSKCLTTASCSGWMPNNAPANIHRKDKSL